MLALAVLRHEVLRSREWSRRGIRIEGYEAQPMDQVFSRRPSIILLDIWHATPEQAIGCWHIHDLLGVPVIAIAESATAGDNIALLQRGAADVVSDSPSVALLAARTRAILRRLGTNLSAPPPTLRWGETVVELTRRTVRRGATEYALSRNEFTLLMMLWRAGGRTCTKGELAAALCGTHDGGGERNLRTYIHHLRRKLEENPEQPVRLINAWGRGYRLVVPEGREAAVHFEHLPLSANQQTISSASASIAMVHQPEFQPVG